MRTSRPVAFGLAVLAVACGGDRLDSGLGAPRTTAPLAANASVSGGGVAFSCPTDFSTFLTMFAGDSALQATRTRFPLENVGIEEGPNEPREVLRLASRAELPDPVFPSTSLRAADSLELRIENGADGRKVVVVWKPDTDLQLRYVFAHDGCWTLVRREDQSL